MPMDDEGLVPSTEGRPPDVSRRSMLAAGPGALLAAMTGAGGRATLASQLSMLQPIAKVPDEVTMFVAGRTEPDEVAIVEDGVE